MIRACETATHIMIDLETMGTSPDAAILAIGAVVFCPETKTIGAQFYRAVDLSSAVAHGGKIAPATVTWWMAQSHAARLAVTQADPVGIIEALVALDDWILDRADRLDGIYVWGNGADFDGVILRSAYERIGHDVPWQHKNMRCYRTLKALAPDVPMDRAGTHHHALDDARSQAEHAIAIMRHLRGAGVAA